MNNRIRSENRRASLAQRLALAPYSVWAVIFVAVPLVFVAGGRTPAWTRILAGTSRWTLVTDVPLEQGQLSLTFMGVHYIVDVGVQTTDFVDVDEHIGIVLEPDDRKPDEVFHRREHDHRRQDAPGAALRPYSPLILVVFVAYTFTCSSSGAR